MAHSTRQRVFLYAQPARTHRIMVAQVGQPSGWPVPLRPVFLPPSGLPPLTSVGTPVVANTSKWSTRHVPIQIRGNLPHRPKEQHSSFFDNCR
ncbi:TPA: ash family protein [Klebsiella variicola]|nr:ash family protein [Klebsiella pneumoniae]HDT2524296.1 ash family protein [Klebsiella pneumoniae subsp. pneumoniae]HDU3539686.1 ash family protein [Klebsiella variicola]EMD5889425.1 ash family protein [Klebsiella pneumoniae]MBY2885246.1 ash family protein [Klebsiella pneumoniae]